MSLRLKQIIRTLGVIGPAVLISVELFDPASIVTATAAGSALGFGVLWATFYSGIIARGNGASPALKAIILSGFAS